MIRSLYTAVSGMISLESRQSTITNNMSNANTIGYKSENLAIKSFDEVYIQNKDKIAAGKNVPQRLGALSLGAEIDTVETAFTQGALKDTGKVTDFAISGRGFFTVQRGNERLYTRDGNFLIGNDNFSIDRNNNISVGGVATHSLALADFQDYGNLEKMGDNYFRGENPMYNTVVTVSQGFVEASNVNITNEMVNIITNQRSFETNQKFVSMLDETLNKAANDIGRV
ncbi:MAG: flagellar hook-basal body complex protein [Clostridium sp.]|uniref:flagellar hook-basal body complex protein n=1 Tax=Clostridium sp. TaxID=1506 RepID=UPI00290D8466|nr:flagellar hook-basal body complex protein [Clostridium sp.]MDU6873749.1 flagellar hook-basal body complex protein [Clostridium sp.]MDU6934776.1 flagellar hook-basal body complex protein [Clostridium sp.]